MKFSFSSRGALLQRSLFSFVYNFKLSFVSFVLIYQLNHHRKMFSKAKRFEPIAVPKGQNKVLKPEGDKDKTTAKSKTPVVKSSSVLTKPALATKKNSEDTHSQCSSSVKSFLTPRPTKTVSSKAPSSLKKPLSCTKPNIKSQIPTKTKAQEELIKSQEVEIRNKDHTISEYNKQIEELKNEISTLQSQIIKTEQTLSDVNELDRKIAQISLAEGIEKETQVDSQNDAFIDDLNAKIKELEAQCEKLELEASGKQVELTYLEEIITIRDSLCKDLQDKLSLVENNLEETHQRLEMVKGHHALALEANESIRREYKAELETLKIKLEEEKQSIIAKSRTDQENVKAKYNNLMESIKEQMLKEKYEAVQELEQQLITKDQEMKAKLEQINEATHEKLRLCEIQFEERTKHIQDHCEELQNKIEFLQKDMLDLKYNASLAEEQNIMLQRELNTVKNENRTLTADKIRLEKDLDEFKEEAKIKLIDFENEKNKLLGEIDKVRKDKNKFEMSLNVTRDIVQVLTMRLRESDNEVECLEDQVQALANSKESLEQELASYKNSLNNTVLECSEYKEALMNIMKSKAALAKEHNRIMEHNVSLIESLQNVEKEAYRELGSIKNDLIEDVELLKKESTSQIQMLRDEVEKKRALCEAARAQAGQAAAAAEHARGLLGQAADEISRLEADNQRYQDEIQDQQSLVVELSLLRQENEELTMTVAKQSSIIDKLKKEMEQLQTKPKSPSLIRKTHKIGKENMQAVSPLRERNIQA